MRGMAGLLDRGAVVGTGGAEIVHVHPQPGREAGRFANGGGDVRRVGGTAVTRQRSHAHLAPAPRLRPPLRALGRQPPAPRLPPRSRPASWPLSPPAPP